MQAEFAVLDVPLAGHIASPGLLDGNDIILAGETAFIGVGSQGNEPGRAGFAKLAQSHGYRVVEVKLAPGVLALRSVAGAVAKDTIVVGADKADAARFRRFPDDRAGARRRAGRGRALPGRTARARRHPLSNGFAQMRRAGITVESIDLYEFAKLGIAPSMLALVLKRE